MIDLLHAFAVGIAFSFGVMAGALLARLSSEKGRKEFNADLKEHWKKCLRLSNAHLSVMKESTVLISDISDTLKKIEKDRRGS